MKSLGCILAPFIYSISKGVCNRDCIYLWLKQESGDLILEFGFLENFTHPGPPLKGRENFTHPGPPLKGRELKGKG